MITCIGEHTIETDLLKGGIAIDIGCRGFEFSKKALEHGAGQVLAYDIDFLEDPGVENLYFHRKAVTIFSKAEVSYRITKDKQAMHLDEENGEGRVEAIDINLIYEAIQQKGQCVDVLKLDCEGAEYLILSDSSFQPIPKQITVEFHEHCQKFLHNQMFERAKENLLKYYEPIKFDRYPAHGAGMNYWDCLFIRKDLIKK